MMFTVPMRFLSAAILSKDAAAVSDELLRLGSLDAVSTRDLPGGGAADPEPATRAGPSIERVRELRIRVEGLLALSGLPAGRPDPAGFAGAEALDPAAVEKSLDTFAALLEGVRERQKNVQERILRLDEILRQAEHFGAVRERRALAGSSFLAVRAGSVPQGESDALDRAFASFAAVLVPSPGGSEDRRSLLLVTLRRDDARVRPLLERYGWKEDASGFDDSALPEGTLREIDARREELRKTLDGHLAELRALFERKGPELADTWARLRATELSLRVRSTFSRTQSLSLLSGWIPSGEAILVEEGIRRASGGRCHIEWQDAREASEAGMDPPVAMRNPRLLAPFQALVTNFGVPRYGTVDPTPFVAVAYLSMFGLMFGDAGHGLVLLVLGRLGVLRVRRRGGSDTLFRLVMYCGASAVVFGLLFGAVFGMPLLPPLWFDYHRIVSGEATGGSGGVRTIYDILGITIRFGMAVLGTGFVLNWVNLVRRRAWIELLLDKAGIVGGWIYAAGAWVAFYFVGHEYRELPQAEVLLPLIALPTLLLGLKAPVEYFHARRAEGGHGRPGFGTFAGFLMEWIVGVLEVYSGYLANTLSFMRVAGLGIAHVSLMVAFSRIASMFDQGGGLSIPGILVLVAGNALVVALEGLSAGIQSLRLNYYEFFSKYFNGTGRAYHPLSFRSVD